MSTPERDPELPEPGRPSRESVRETLVERKIREAIEEGSFDGLPHQGTRLPLEDDSPAGEWAMAYRMLRSAGAAPPWIESDRAVRALLDERDALLTRALSMTDWGRVRAREDLVRIVDAANLAIERVNAEAPTDRQHRRLLDRAVELDRFDRVASDEASKGG